MVVWSQLYELGIRTGSGRNFVVPALQREVLFSNAFFNYFGKVNPNKCCNVDNRKFVSSDIGTFSQALVQNLVKKVNSGFCSIC